MAVRILSRVWEFYPGGGSDLLSLLALADWSDDEGRCYPSMSSIAKKTRLSVSQARRVVHGLIDNNYVYVVGNANGGPKGCSRQYKINLDLLTPSAHARGGVDARGGTHASDGLHPCAFTPSAHASQTIIEPSLTVTTKSKGKIKLLPDGSFENVDGYLDVWKKAYPHLDLLNELRKAGAWCISNPNKAPKSNFSRFLNGWLSRNNTRPENDLMAGVI